MLSGDLRVVDVLDLGTCQPPQEYGDAPGQGWGYTGVFAKVNGGGFLTDHFPDAYKAIWDFHGQEATSRQVPGVRYNGITHPGPFGTAPSAELLAEWGRGGAHGPACENGGSQDIKNFTRGSRIYYPVHVAGAKLSGSDLHFSQGDGEITFCGAIGMDGFTDFGVDVIKDGMNKYGVTTNPILIPGRVEPRYSELLTFIGVSVDETTGENYYMDASVAYRCACLNAIEYLRKFGYSGEQAYRLLGSAPIEWRISGIVDIPNACCTLYLPTEIFDFDVRPSKDGPAVAERGMAAQTSLRCAALRLRLRGMRAVRARPADGRGELRRRAALAPGSPSGRGPRRRSSTRRSLSATCNALAAWDPPVRGRGPPSPAGGRCQNVLRCMKQRAVRGLVIDGIEVKARMKSGEAGAASAEAHPFFIQKREITGSSTIHRLRRRGRCGHARGAAQRRPGPRLDRGAGYILPIAFSLRGRSATTSTQAGGLRLVRPVMAMDRDPGRILARALRTATSRATSGSAGSRVRSCDSVLLLLALDRPIAGLAGTVAVIEGIGTARVFGRPAARGQDRLQ